MYGFLWCEPAICRGHVACCVLALRVQLPHDSALPFPLLLLLNIKQVLHCMLGQGYGAIRLAKVPPLGKLGLCVWVGGGRAPALWKVT